MHKENVKKVMEFCEKEGVGFVPHLSSQFGDYGLVFFTDRGNGKLYRCYFKDFSNPDNDAIIIGTVEECCSSFVLTRALYCYFA